MRFADAQDEARNRTGAARASAKHEQYGDDT
jgi:hypothetical protein